MSIKLIAADVDGTFFDDDHHYNIERFNQQLKWMKANDVRFVIASGNMYGHLVDIFPESPIDTFIAENGGLIRNEHEIIHEATLDKTVWYKLLAHIKQTYPEASVVFSTPMGTFLSKDDPALGSDWYEYYFSNIHVVDHLSEQTMPLYKLNIMLDGDMADIAQEINSHFSNQVHATPSGYGNVDMIPAGVNKGFGLEKLEEYWNIKPEEVMAFGDNLNDLEMLQHAKYGFVMKNGQDRFPKNQFSITKFDNNHDGVLDTIDEYVIKPNQN